MRILDGGLGVGGVEPVQHEDVDWEVQLLLEGFVIGISSLILYIAFYSLDSSSISRPIMEHGLSSEWIWSDVSVGLSSDEYQ